MLTKNKVFPMLACVIIATLFTGCWPFGKKDKDLDPMTSMPGIGQEGDLPDIPFLNNPSEKFFRPVKSDVVLEAVRFGYDSTQILSSEMRKLAAVSTYLQDNAGDVVIVEGHCDERGSREYNVALGERRALAVRAFLIGQGVAVDRLQTRSMGEEVPADTGHSESAWSVNRRAEFEIH